VFYLPTYSLLQVDFFPGCPGNTLIFRLSICDPHFPLTEKDNSMEHKNNAIHIFLLNEILIACYI